MRRASDGMQNLHAFRAHLEKVAAGGGSSSSQRSSLKQLHKEYQQLQKQCSSSMDPRLQQQQHQQHQEKMHQVTTSNHGNSAFLPPDTAHYDDLTSDLAQMSDPSTPDGSFPPSPLQGSYQSLPYSPSLNRRASNMTSDPAQFSYPSTPDGSYSSSLQGSHQSLPYSPSLNRRASNLTPISDPATSPTSPYPYYLPPEFPPGFPAAVNTNRRTSLPTAGGPLLMNNTRRKSLPMSENLMHNINPALLSNISPRFSRRRTSLPTSESPLPHPYQRRSSLPQSPLAYNPPSASSQSDEEEEPLPEIMQRSSPTSLWRHITTCFAPSSQTKFCGKIWSTYTKWWNLAASRHTVSW